VRVEVDLALWEVVDKRFDETRDGRNIYACMEQQIRARIGSLLRQSRQLSETQRKHAPRVYAAQQRLEQELLRTVTAEEIAQASGLSLQHVEEVLRPRRALDSEAATLSRETENPIGPDPAEEVLQRQESHRVREQIAQAVQTLLAPEEVPKFLILLELNVVRDYAWPEIARHFREEAHAPLLPIVYSETHHYAWSDAYGLFQQPPPSVTASDGDPLLRWFHAQWRKLMPVLRRCLHELGPAARSA
jgi:hypothetical protein